MIIRIALMIFMIQYLVILTVLVATLLTARPEVPILGRESVHKALIRSLVFVSTLPRRTTQLAARLVRFVRTKLSAPAYYI